MADLKLTYFDFHGGRGEPARLALSRQMTLITAAGYLDGYLKPLARNKESRKSLILMVSAQGLEPWTL